jgi:hypothetical protein
MRALGLLGAVVIDERSPRKDSKLELVVLMGEYLRDRLMWMSDVMVCCDRSHL